MGAVGFLRTRIRFHRARVVVVLARRPQDRRQPPTFAAAPDLLFLRRRRDLRGGADPLRLHGPTHVRAEQDSARGHASRGADADGVGVAGSGVEAGHAEAGAAPVGAFRARFDRAPGSAAGASGDPVCRPDLLLADPADSFSRDDRPQSLLDNELEHDRRRRAVLEPCARSATVAARASVVRGARRARFGRDVSADRRRRRDRVQPDGSSIPTTISVAGYILR